MYSGALDRIRSSNPRWRSTRTPAGKSRGAGTSRKRKHIVVAGAGFGGLNAAMGLRGVDADVTIIDRSNHHLFQPLLYQVATAALSPAQIAMPIRRILSSQGNATVLMETVQAVDQEARTVTTCTRSLGYDFLVVATGARHAYFGRDDW